MNIGDYVRTKSYGIKKINGFSSTLEEDFIDCDYDKYQKVLINKKEVINSNPNLIDLIEEGDLIKLKFTKQIQQVLSKNESEIDLTDYVFYDLKNSNVVEEIDWVITHEQIEQMKYKVGE